MDMKGGSDGADQPTIFFCFCLDKFFIFWMSKSFTCATAESLCEVSEGLIISLVYLYSVQYKDYSVSNCDTVRRVALIWS